MPGLHGQESRLAQNLAIMASLLFVKGQKGHKSMHKSKQADNKSTISLRNVYKNRQMVIISIMYSGYACFLILNVYSMVY